jgi:hypothetical protein
VLGEDPELMEQALGDYNDDYEDESELIESGVVISVSKEIPCQVSVKNELGETLNFLWINYIIAPDNFVAKPETLVGKKIDIVYYLDDIFNPKSGEYQSRKILIELTPQK